MPAHFSARFMRVGTHLINLEAIQQVSLKADDSAVVTLNGPRKALQQIPVPTPHGRELWDFVHQNLVIVEFGDAVENGRVSKRKREESVQKQQKKPKRQD